MAATTKNAPRYWGKQGEEYNYLFILSPAKSLLIRWMEMADGIKVFRISRLKGKPRQFQKGYERVDADLAAEVLLAATHDLQTSMPYR